MDTKQSFQIRYCQQPQLPLLWEMWNSGTFACGLWQLCTTTMGKSITCSHAIVSRHLSATCLRWYHIPTNLFSPWNSQHSHPHLPCSILASFFLLIHETRRNINQRRWDNPPNQPQPIPMVRILAHSIQTTKSLFSYLEYLSHPHWLLSIQYLHSLIEKLESAVP